MEDSDDQMSASEEEESEMSIDESEDTSSSDEDSEDSRSSDDDPEDSSSSDDDPEDSSSSDDDSEDSSSSDDDSEDSSSSDDNSNDENVVQDIFKIGSSIFTDVELTKLVKSSTLIDRIRLNHIVEQIVKHDSKVAFGYLLYHGYKIDPVNNKGQTAVHLLFYQECKRILERQKLKGLTKKLPTFGSRPKELIDLNPMGFLSGVLFNNQHSKLFKHSDLLITLIQEWFVDKTFDLKAIDCYGLTYMHITCLIGEKNLVKKCLKQGMDVNARFSHPEILYKNYTPLHFGVLNPLIDTANIVDALLKNGADVTAKDVLGRTALHLACRFYQSPKDFQILSKTLKKNVNLDQLASLIVKNPQDFYTKNSYLVDRLLKKSSDVNAKDEAGNTPLLSIFPEKYNDELSRFRQDWHEFGVPIKETTIKFAFLMNAGADVTVRNVNGDTILHLITRNLKLWRGSSDYTEIEFDDSYHTEMIRAVLTSCPQLDINIKNNLGETPLQLAVECMSSDIVKLLWEYGADLSTLTDKENLLWYPDITPNFEAACNLISIIELFENNSFKLTDKTHFKVLKFLVHYTDKCLCTEKDYRHYALIFGSDIHLRSILYRLPTMLDSNSKDDSVKDLDYYLDIVNETKAYIDEEIKESMEYLTDHDYSESSDILSYKIKKELRLMKSAELDNKVTVYNLVRMHPYNIPRHVLNKMNDELMKQFITSCCILRGQITKSTIRHYVKKTGRCYVQDLLPILPDICCEIIVDYLSNEAILNVCLAVNFQNISKTEECLLVKC